LYFIVAAGRNLESLGGTSECYSSLQLCEFFVYTNADIFLQLSGQGDATPPLSAAKSSQPTEEKKCSVGKSSSSSSSFTQTATPEALMKAAVRRRLSMGP